MSVVVVPRTTGVLWSSTVSSVDGMKPPPATVIGPPATGVVVSTVGVGGSAHDCSGARTIGSHDCSRPWIVCDVANVLTPKPSFGLAMRPRSLAGLASCCESSHAVGLAYAVAVAAGAAVLRQHGDST